MLSKTGNLKLLKTGWPLVRDKSGSEAVRDKSGIFEIFLKSQGYLMGVDKTWTPLVDPIVEPL